MTYKNYEKYCKWKDILKKEDQKKDDTYISQNFKLCNNHFEKYYITAKKRLTRHAVPSLHAGITPFQEELLCKFIEDNPEIIEGNTLNGQILDKVKNKWKEIELQLNARGPDKNYVTWAKYLFEIISNLKTKDIKWTLESFVSMDKPPLTNTEDFTKVELKILQLWSKDNLKEDQQDNFESDFRDENGYTMEHMMDSDNSRDSETSRISRTSRDNEIVTFTLNVATGGHTPLLQAVDIAPYEVPQDYSNANCMCNREDQDEFDAFGREIAQQLRSMPAQTAMETRKLLMSVLRSKQSKILNDSFLEN